MRMDRDKCLQVLYLVDSLRVGGKERQVVELLKGLRLVKHLQLMVVTMGQEQFYVPQIRDLGIPLVYLVRQMRWDPFVFNRLYRILKDFKPHMVHTNSDMATFYALPLSKLQRIKLVNGAIRNAFSSRGFRWNMHRALLWLSDARVANSKAGFESRGLLARANGNYIIHNGFDMGRFEAVEAQGDRNLNLGVQGKKVVGMVAEFSDYKDYPTYLRTAEIILERRNDVMFVAVGGGKHLEACKRMVAPAADGIRFLGERKDIEAIVSAMHIGVLCTYTEGISNSIMEYMAAEKPVVVTDCGGNREIVMEGESGFLVSRTQPEVLAQKIELLLDDSALARRMGEAGEAHLPRHILLYPFVYYYYPMYGEGLVRWN